MWILAALAFGNKLLPSPQLLTPAETKSWPPLVGQYLISKYSNLLSYFGVGMGSGNGYL